MKVIVGGGPNGLYLAIKLYQAGVKDILVVDPRAGHYTRPGHIIGEAFEHAEDSLGVLFSDSDEPISFGHIKDIERVLYSHAVSLGIDICAQKFVGLRKGSQKRLPCVILEEAGKTNLVPVEYLFDCSGTKRVVINAVNDLMSPASPFRVTPMTEVAVKKHALMYVRMPDADFEDLRLAREHQFELNDADDPCRYVQSIEQLRAFGWQEVGYPQYSVWPSGKGKVGLYSEVSPTLRDEDVLAWMTLLFEREVPSKVARFEVLPNPRAKPRITTFSVFPHELHRFSYQHPDLPMIIAHGDAHIEPNYYLAHGIFNGFKRIDQMMRCVTIFNGNIVHFNEAMYAERIREIMDIHRTEVIEHYQERDAYFLKALHFADRAYKKVLLRSDIDAVGLLPISATAAEIRGRLLYHEAKDLMRLIKTVHGVPSSATGEAVILRYSLNKLQSLIKEAFVYLPVHFKKERQDITESLIQLESMLAAITPVPPVSVKASPRPLKSPKFFGAATVRDTQDRLDDISPTSQSELLAVEAAARCPLGQ